ncbi:hypothetical protein [Clostridium butyricum]|uniref:hypothetical protein n=1 Tax=Clostridium butyricum TaxID=1492 RepID=UPI0032C11170
MQRKVTVSEEIVTDIGKLKVDISVLELLSIIVYELSKESGIKPEVKCIYKDKSLWILFDNSCFQCDNLIEDYGELIGLVSNEFLITINGVIDTFEIGTIKMIIEDGKMKIQKSNTTGKDFDIISDLCIKIEMRNNEELQFLYEVLSSVQYNKTCISIRRKWDKYLSNNRYIGTKYNYIQFENIDDEQNDFVNSLSIFQMTELWIDFLENKYTYIEFDVLYENFKNGNMRRIFAWELALRIALSKLSISIENSSDGFKIVDSNGNQIHYTFESKSSAEKILLKILFPSNVSL